MDSGVRYFAVACWCRGVTYGNKGGSTEARAAVEPVIIAQLIDLDAPPVRRLMRHRLCHHQRLGFHLGYPAIVGEETWGEIKMLLKRQFRVSLTYDGECRHLLGSWGARY